MHGDHQRGTPFGGDRHRWRVDDVRSAQRPTEGGAQAERAGELAEAVPALVEGGTGQGEAAYGRQAQACRGVAYGRPGVPRGKGDDLVVGEQPWK